MLNESTDIVKKWSKMSWSKGLDVIMGAFNIITVI